MSAAAWILVLALQTPTPSAAPQDRVRISSSGQTLEADRGESEIDTDGRRITILIGGLEAHLADQSIKADRAIAWSVDEGEEPRIRELYAEGNIVFRRKDPKTGRETTFRAERLYVEFATGKVYIIDLRLKAFAERLKMSVVIRAKEAHSIVQGTLIADEITVSTCTFGDPDFKVNVLHAKVEGKHEIGKRKPYDIWPYDDWSVRGEKISADLWGIPFFFLPGVAFGRAISDFPVKSFHGGNSSRFRSFLYSELGWTIRKGTVDGLNPWDDSGKDDDREKWGEVLLEADWRQKRGWGGGLDLKWKHDNYHGYVDTYGLHDYGPDPNNDFDQKFLPLEDPDRWRVRAFQRMDFGADWRVEGEMSRLSDRNLLEEFFEKEFKTGKEQESALYVRWRHDTMAGYLEGRYRINDFQSQVEHLPRGRFFLYDQPAWPEPVSVSGAADLGEFRFRPDHLLAGVEPEHTWRADASSRLTAVAELGFLSLAPFAEGRATEYQRDLAFERESRLTATAGARLVSTLSGVHDVEWEALGIHKIRHIARIEVKYADTVSNSLDPAELFPYDTTDRVDKFREVALEMRHRFQTKVREGDAWVTQEFLELAAEIEYYPEPARDTVFPNDNNVAPPFNWITLPPTDTLGTFKERDWSDLHWYGRVELRRGFSITGEGSYNPEERQEETRQFILATKPWTGMSLTAGEIFLKDVTNAFTVGMKWDVTEKWGVHIDAQYDFRNESFIRKSLLVRRDFHDFWLEVGVEEDKGRDDRQFSIKIEPKFFKTKER